MNQVAEDGEAMLKMYKKEISSLTEQLNKYKEKVSILLVFIIVTTQQNANAIVLLVDYRFVAKFCINLS